MATAKAVTIQVELSLLTPRLPAIVGSDTLAIVVSSTCMKVANDSPIVVSTVLGGRKVGAVMKAYWIAAVATVATNTQAT